MQDRTQPTLFSRLRQYAISIAFAFLLVTFCWFAVRTQIGSMFGELTSPSSIDAVEIADSAIALAPGDSRPRWLSAMALKRSFEPQDIDLSVERLKEAVARNPNDFRMWLDLARGYEQSDRPADAEAALERAIQLAPTYAAPNWQAANFFIRQGRLEDAKSNLVKVTKSDSPLRSQAFALAWTFYKDPVQLEAITSPTAGARAYLALYFAQIERGKDSLRVWDQLTREEKARYGFLSKAIAFTLYKNGYGHEALSFGRDAGIAEGVVPGSMFDGGFEGTIREPENEIFGWRINRQENNFEAMQVSSEASEGKRSIKLVFRNFSKPGFFNVAQSVVVEPGERFRLSFKIRSENLRSAGMPYLNISALKPAETIAQTELFEIGSNDWKEISVEFRVPEAVDVIDIRTVRQACSAECAISGILWYDDFRLQRL